MGTPPPGRPQQAKEGLEELWGGGDWILGERTRVSKG